MDKCFILNKLLKLYWVFILILAGGRLHATAATEIIVVDQQGRGNFTTIQAAINSVRAFRGEHAVRIWVKNGIYHEKVVIPSYLENIQLIGEDVTGTKIVYDDHAGKMADCPDETGEIKRGTFNSYTLLVRANSVLIKNITIENAAGPVGQAVALHLEGDRIAVVNCRLLGYQDTLYLGKSGGKNYFANCSIYGTTDFIFGPGTSFFCDCKLFSLSNSYVTAASTPAGERYGYVFYKSQFLPVDQSVMKVFLGRPWRPYANTVLVDCYLGPHIVPEGWNEWHGDELFPQKEKTVFYAELGSKGEGAKDLSKRKRWSHQLGDDKREFYRLEQVMGDWNVNKMLHEMGE
ncbi:pectinesterase family protein [Sphingobacterium thalpophilum]|uniref:pectinesterase family protein n=1 Tax=Sphingobacterium thalpophilum TaxID=259 RepID=UPI0024A685AA|nr:pectinesterase family protein [Sphingobacterium thalpophilum]